MARREREALKRPKLPVLIIDHPIGGLRPDDVVVRIRQAVERLTAIVPPLQAGLA
jgi:hypothetical protein